MGMYASAPKELPNPVDLLRIASGMVWSNRFITPHKRLRKINNKKILDKW